MLRIDATFEDCRIIAKEHLESDKVFNGLMEVEFHDVHSGKQKMLIMDLNELGKILAYAASGLDGEAMPLITYEEVSDLVDCVPAECRPIP